MATRATWGTVTDPRWGRWRWYVDVRRSASSSKIYRRRTIVWTNLATGQVIVTLEGETPWGLRAQMQLNLNTPL
jgi:hypothetical protein